MRPVAITGVGSISALGHSNAELREGLKACRPAIGPLSLVPTDDLAVKIGAEVANYEPAAYFDEGRVGLLDRFAQFGLIAAREGSPIPESVSRARFPRAPRPLSAPAWVGRPLKTTITCGCTEDARRLHPFTIPRLMVNAAASAITMELGAYRSGLRRRQRLRLGHPRHRPGVSHGTRGNRRCGAGRRCRGVHHLRHDEGLGGVRVMSTDTCRPFCKTRSGMVLGEGAAMVVLEPLEAAVRRGATIHAELAGFGMSADAGDIVQPSAEGAAAAIVAALDDGGLAGADIDYVNAHGTGTAVNDRTETKALHTVSGEHAPRLAISSTKSMHGHAMGAAGALELAATIMALDEGIVAPTANFVEPDPDCDLDYVPNQAREAPVRAAISNSFAFGGLNAVLALRRFEG